jgi:hypothetical protein
MLRLLAWLVSHEQTNHQNKPYQPNEAKPNERAAIQVERGTNLTEY